jgi:hypothetical protein
VLVVFSVFGTALDGTNYFLFDDFETCASVSDLRVPECYNGTTAPFYYCVGDPSYNNAAVRCQAEDGAGACSCVSSTSSSGCSKSLNGFPTCLFIITDFVKLLHASFLLCVVCLVSSATLLTLCGYIWCFLTDLRESSMMNDSLMLSECPAVIPAEATYAQPLRQSQVPINLSFVDIRPAGESTIERYAAGDTTRITSTGGAIILRPSAVTEVHRLDPEPGDGIVTPVNVAYPVQPINR